MKPYPTIGAVLLAAGRSRRMGIHKLGLPLGDATIGSRTLRTLITAPFTNIYVVVHPQDPLKWISEEFHKEPFKPLWNLVPSERAEDGQSQSLRAGMHAAMRDGMEAIVVCMADQPFISLKQIQHLINKSIGLNEGKDYYAFTINGELRPPVLFSNRVFSILDGLEGDEGARSIIKSGVVQGSLMEWNVPDWYLDIDTPKDYTSAMLKWNSLSPMKGA
jgi:molybdenum cofactor cytidylyltransferase